MPVVIYIYIKCYIIYASTGNTTKGNSNNYRMYTRNNITTEERNTERFLTVTRVTGDNFTEI